MQETFKFQWKRGLFWKSRDVCGFSADAARDRMMLYFPNGSTLELAQWSKTDCYLGSDFFHIKKAKMEQEAGQSIPVDVAKE